VDDEYLARSIRDPQAQLVKGYPASMPPQRVTDQDVRDISAYIKSLQ
jgi:cytochrome c oxidase subunit 2